MSLAPKKTISVNPDGLENVPNQRNSRNRSASPAPRPISRRLSFSTPGCKNGEELGSCRLCDSGKECKGKPGDELWEDDDDKGKFYCARCWSGAEAEGRCFGRLMGKEFALFLVGAFLALLFGALLLVGPAMLQGKFVLFGSQLAEQLRQSAWLLAWVRIYLSNASNYFGASVGEIIGFVRLPAWEVSGWPWVRIYLSNAANNLGASVGEITSFVRVGIIPAEPNAPPVM